VDLFERIGSDGLRGLKPLLESNDDAGAIDAIAG